MNNTSTFETLYRYSLLHFEIASTSLIVVGNAVAMWVKVKETLVQNGPLS